jgi:hypothetical protein
MLKPTPIPDTATTNRLVKLWTARYFPNLFTIPLQKGLFPIAQIIEATSQTARAETIKQVKLSLRFNCELSGFKTYALFSDSTNNLTSVRHSARVVEQVYTTMFEIYLRQSPLDDFLKYIDPLGSLFNRLSLPALTLSAISQVTSELEPSLLQLQKHHLDYENPLASGFLTTHFRFCNQKILEPLTVIEQVLLSPYLKFIEEQVCMPWQQVCAAAANYSITSPVFILVEQLFAASSVVAKAVYHQAVPSYPVHRSRRGAFGSPDVAASTIRDLNMVQSYLCLCILEDDITVAEQELLLLCQVVLPSVGVKWELVEYIVQLLIKEIPVRVDKEYLNLLTPYTRALQGLFTINPAG